MQPCKCNSVLNTVHQTTDDMDKEVAVPTPEPEVVFAVLRDPSEDKEDTNEDS